MKRNAASLSLFCTMVLIAGCATVQRTETTTTETNAEAGDSNYTDDLRDVAMQIEAAITAGDREAVIESRGSIVANSAIVAQAIRTRAARAVLVEEFRATGHVIEQWDGLLHIQRSREYKDSGTRRSRDRDAVLIMGENQNRWSIYEGILEASDMSNRHLNTVQKTFTEVRIKQLKPGDRYVNQEGEKVVK